MREYQRRNINLKERNKSVVNQVQKLQTPIGEIEGTSTRFRTCLMIPTPIRIIGRKSIEGNI